MENAPKLTQLSEKRKQKLKERKDKRRDKAREKAKEAELDRLYEPEAEVIRFGEVVDRPPTFDRLPEERKAVSAESKMRQLAALIASKSGGAVRSTMDDGEGEGEGEGEEEMNEASEDAAAAAAGGARDDEYDVASLGGTLRSSRGPTGRSATHSAAHSVAQSAAQAFAERRALLEQARAVQHEVEVERTRDAVQAAYKELKQKKMHGHRGMASLGQSAQTLNAGVRYAQDALRSLGKDRTAAKPH